jgi:hypothetical protein
LAIIALTSLVILMLFYVLREMSFDFSVGAFRVPKLPNREDLFLGVPESRVVNSSCLKELLLGVSTWAWESLAV